MKMKYHRSKQVQSNIRSKAKETKDTIVIIKTNAYENGISNQN